MHLRSCFEPVALQLEVGGVIRECLRILLSSLPNVKIRSALLEFSPGDIFEGYFN
jgi:hypothetical protein